MPETVWAVHNFEAEADDEISFHIGEPIVILQKDELYQDGWWECTETQKAHGRNEVEEVETFILWRPMLVV
ncbi:hypothetical protein BG000_000322 [Podila horticola]|nr:hypothetical protein BG000_000322 [Podila horticola]